MWLHVPNSLASTSAQDTEDSNSGSDSLESTLGPWLTLSGTPTRRPLLWQGWKNRTWIKRLSGTISQPSTADRGAAEWIASLPVSPVSLSAQQDQIWELTTTAGSGLPSNESFVEWDRDLCSWKTSPDLFGEVFPLSSLILPSSGSMRNGVCTQRPRLAHRINGNASGSWPTPTGSDAHRGTDPERGPAGGGHTLKGTVSNWPTPRAHNSINMSQESAGRPGGGPDLPEAALNWPTPRATNPARSSAQGTARPTLNEEACGRESDKQWPTPQASEYTKHGGMTEETAIRRKAAGQQEMLSQLIATNSGLPQETETGPSILPRVDLNPRFVEALMGLPPGWLTPSILVGTDSCHRWLRRHSSNSSEGTATSKAVAWPTPTAHDSVGTGPSQIGRNSPDLNSVIVHSLWGNNIPDTDLDELELCLWSEQMTGCHGYGVGPEDECNDDCTLERS